MESSLMCKSISQINEICQSTTQDGDQKNKYELFEISTVKERIQHSISISKQKKDYNSNIKDKLEQIVESCGENNSNLITLSLTLKKMIKRIEDTIAINMYNVEKKPLSDVLSNITKEYDVFIVESLEKLNLQIYQKYVVMENNGVENKWFDQAFPEELCKDIPFRDWFMHCNKDHSYTIRADDIVKITEEYRKTLLIPKSQGHLFVMYTPWMKNKHNFVEYLNEISKKTECATWFDKEYARITRPTFYRDVSYYNTLVKQYKLMNFEGLRENILEYIYSRAIDNNFIVDMYTETYLLTRERYPQDSWRLNRFNFPWYLANDKLFTEHSSYVK